MPLHACNVCNLPSAFPLSYTTTTTAAAGFAYPATLSVATSATTTTPRPFPARRHRRESGLVLGKLCLCCRDPIRSLEESEAGGEEDERRRGMKNVKKEKSISKMRGSAGRLIHKDVCLYKKTLRRYLHCSLAEDGR